MSSIEFTVNVNDPQIADFLADRRELQIVRRANQPNGFSEQYRRDNTVDRNTADVPFLMREFYRLKLNNVPAGTVAAEVFLRQTLSFWVEYVLFLRDGLSQEVIDRAKTLVKEYDPNVVPDLSAWMAEKLKEGWITESDVALLADIHIEKVGLPADVNTTQRDALFRLYDLEHPASGAPIHILPEANFSRWANQRRATLELIDTEAVKANSPQIGREIAEVDVDAAKEPGETAQGLLSSILDDVSRHILPTECAGGFRREELRMLSVLGWPEFKLEWQTISIRVGCATIQITVPVLRIRFANLVLFIYYHVPKTPDVAILTIVKNCAIRSALSGAVIGIVVGNPAVAIAAFQSFFVDCLRQDAFDCINPGLIMVKEVEGWR